MLDYFAVTLDIGQLQSYLSDANPTLRCQYEQIQILILS